jgi:hypothetical protein
MKKLKSLYGIKTKIKTKLYSAVIKNNKGFGLSEFLGIAVALIIAAFVIIPRLQEFATKIMNDMDYWWKNTISPSIFPDSYS